MTPRERSVLFGREVFGRDVFDGVLFPVLSVPCLLAEPAPVVQLSNFAADGLELTLSLWIADPENGLRGVRSDANLAILATRGQLGIEIPFPQRVVHQTAVPDSTPTAQLPMLVAPPGGQGGG